MNEKRLYRISPSLLNKFSDWLNAGEDWARWWGEAAEPELSREEYEGRKLGELISYINGDTQEPSEAADRGTCLNEIVDCRLGNAPRADVRWEEREDCFQAEKDGHVFLFDKGMVDDLVQTFSVSVAQYHLEHSYDFAFGRVVLHGYADYIFPTMIWDLKTTGKYSPEKYAENWQRHVYPVVAVDSGDLTECESFTFLALECARGKLISGREYRECYDVNVAESRCKVLEFVTSVVVPQLDRWLRDGRIGRRVVMPLEPESLGAAGEMVSHRKGGEL